MHRGLVTHVACRMSDDLGLQDAALQCLEAKIACRFPVFSARSLRSGVAAHVFHLALGEVSSAIWLSRVRGQTRTGIMGLGPSCHRSPVDFAGIAGRLRSHCGQRAHFVANIFCRSVEVVFLVVPASSTDLVKGGLEICRFSTPCTFAA